MYKTPVPDADDTVDNFGVDTPLATGVDVNGKTRSCEDQSDSNLNCTMIFTEADQFANDCKALGSKAIMCGCHDYICVGENIPNSGSGQVIDQGGLYVGQDYQGNTRSCADKQAQSICTGVLTASDSYAINCRNQGGRAVMCACHDWICVRE